VQFVSYDYLNDVDAEEQCRNGAVLEILWLRVQDRSRGPELAILS